MIAGECLRDLLHMSAKLLRPGGRLVYFLPAAPEVYREEEVPQHPALQLVANSEQVLSTKFSRRLITMEKVASICRSILSYLEPQAIRERIDDIWRTVDGWLAVPFRILWTPVNPLVICARYYEAG